MKRKRGRKRGGMSTLAAGALALAAIVIFTYLGFTKFANPFANQYTIHAIFSSANGLAPASLVRVAGVNVGKVSSVSPVANCKNTAQTASQCSASDVTMTIDKQGLPLHKDATFDIRPRIFLEGNFFVDIHPGSPEAPVAPSGYVFPIQQGTEPVQFDQVLTSLQGNTRADLQTLLQQYGTAVKQAGPSYNKSINYWLPAYEYSSVVAHDALGIQPHDLSNWIAQQGTVAGALSAHPQNLENLVTDFNTTANAFARQSSNLQAAVAQLPKTLSAAIPAFNSLNAAFPPLEELATALIPGVKSTGPMVDASLPFITQLRLLVQPSELEGLTQDLKTTIPALTQLTKETIPLLKNEVRPASSCVANNIYPWSQLTVPDSHFNSSNGFPARQVFEEAVDFLPGLAGESRNFDANGPYIRVNGALGDTAVTSLGNGLVGGTTAPIVGEQPLVPSTGSKPPTFAPTVPCETQAQTTDLSAASQAAPPSYSPTGTLPTGLVQSLLGSLPLGLSKDVKTSSGSKASTTSTYKPLTAAQRLADLSTIAKDGLFDIYPSSKAAFSSINGGSDSTSSSSTTSTTANSTKASGTKASSTKTSSTKASSTKASAKR